MTELEEKAYAYVIERQKDPNYPTYNWETEISDAYEQGYKDAIDKACEWLKDNHADIFLRYLRGHDSEDEVEHFKKFMEEQQ